jgi:hypothetical protein
MRAAVLALVLLPYAARAEPPVHGRDFPRSLIDRPLILPTNFLEVSLLGNLSNEGAGTSGAATALGVEVGSGEGQAGLAVALPVNPDFGFGSVAGSLAYSLTRQAAFRIDLGFDHSQGHDGRADTNFYYGAVGLPAKVRLSPWLALVSGRVGAIDFAHFVNLNDGGGSGFYQGAGQNAFSSSNLLTFTKQEDGPTQIGVNLPAGLLIQVADSLALTLRAGYEVIISTSTGDTKHFLPVGLEAVYSPTRDFDLGASFSLPGPIATTVSSSSLGYTDIRLAVLWLRFRT